MTQTFISMSADYILRTEVLSIVVVIIALVFLFCLYRLAHPKVLFPGPVAPLPDMSSSIFEYEPKYSPLSHCITMMAEQELVRQLVCRTPGVAPKPNRLKWEMDKAIQGIRDDIERTLWFR